MIRRLLLATLGFCLLALPVSAGVLVKGRLEGVPVTLELGPDRDLVLITIKGQRRLVDLAQRQVYLFDGDRPRRISAGLYDDGASSLPYDLRRWSNGPPIAGHASSYNVLQVGDLICAEVLASGWMREFTEPLIRSVGYLQGIDDRFRPHRRGACGAIPFSAYATNGWPLMAGWKEGTAFVTETIRFDHKVDAALMVRPRNYID